MGWPMDVEDIAIMRNRTANPEADPQKMVVHDRTYVPSVDEGTETATKLAETLLEHEPSEEGGFFVRITSNGGDVAYVPLYGLAYSTSTQDLSVANPMVSPIERLLRFPVYGGFIVAA